MTSLSAAAKIASSSLAATQVQMSVTASNIANADTEGYTKKSATTSALTSAGTGSGVSIGDISSGVSTLLMKQLTSATSETAAAEKTADYLDQLQSAMGSTTSSDDTGTSLANMLANVETAVSDLAGTPESTSLAYSTLSALETLTTELNDLSSTIQDLRSNADSDIATSVDAANAAIEAIDALNDQIVAAKASGASTGDLEDQRNTALAELSQYLGVTSFLGSDGSMKVYTTSGQVLVDSTAHTLSFDETATITASQSYDGTSSGLSGITVDGNDITDSISTGTIGSLLELRDETLPAAQDMLDELSDALITTLNAVIPDLLTGTSASDIAVNQDMLSDPSTLLSGSSGTAAETAEALLDALQGETSFDKAGSLSARQEDFASYATDILSLIVSQSNAADKALELAQTELTTVTDTISSTYGVNVDEETVRLTELEQLYSVSSQILSILKEMFEDLLAAVQ
ncbi:flagellar hook-associated protein FlgK [Roseibium suaedae]|uniref:Flagellar hook-associated protein 1 n=1 Tax=Roseibium suaedae TaxID=735517 RepID=A0A1M7IBV4_9HYPH|nr:flagellar hook-associated protein FlgK [Roseibium suaedae]SHM38073.1 flagellar hook-associated protein 1 FlgK [Roseibium suaedae]